ncbi:nitrile hydratase [Rhodococcus rhodochrous J38]|uniref:nitrile hydratase accessory protein n=1 Tax=Rhodococcus rhodochrous TaxID=1829 RepID=UPI0011A15266|nr:nitrile hydratase accessory protein [Rhodococcus rhodochrous]TWH41894.1 nitrile hydratase [Rhodococcus rhodochrous J38]
MSTLNEQPSQQLRDQLGELVEQLPFSEHIPRRSGDVAFDEPWEIRAFSITTALHADCRFQWDEFQSRLIKSIKQWESENTSTDDWSYYEQWMHALEELMRDTGMVSEEELEQRTAQVLATPANANHQHAVREPITIAAPADTGDREGSPR